MKRNQIHYVLVLLIALTWIPFAAVAQETEPELSREEMQLQRARDKVARAETSVARGQAYLDKGDSLITVGEQMMSEAKVELKQFKEEKSGIDKTYNSEKKLLEKDLKTDNTTERNNARQAIRDLDAQYRLDARTINTTIKESNRKYDKGISNISRGREKQKMGNEKLKPANKALTEAKKQLQELTGVEEVEGTETEKKGFFKKGKKNKDKDEKTIPEEKAVDKKDDKKTTDAGEKDGEDAKEDEKIETKDKKKKK